ncbi:hypothetical protein QR680_002307 [Steinernema hermaphroditum]|uniref:DNA mismatch repair proteins mutS family domain-containing protein n=1 Tax=Steinernema hermaphroditum TaxID=289476 RepID=A0AA39LHW2_9BILA|nr:hypothetical protein QR680_002307 [Steinernema hermaphroditum]
MCARRRSVPHSLFASSQIEYDGAAMEQRGAAVTRAPDHYRVYDDDAMLIAGRVLHSDSSLTRACIGGQDVQYMTLNSSQYTRTVRELLLVCNYRVEVFELVSNQWKQKLKGSQTNMIDFEEIIGDCDELADLSTCMGIICPSTSSMEAMVTDNGESCARDTFCVVFVNIYDRRLTYTSFREGEHISKLQKFLVSTNPRQCFLFTDSNEPTPLLAVEDIRPHGKGSAAFPLVHQCGSYLMTSLQIGEEYEGQFTLGVYNNDIFMYMDNSVIRALEKKFTLGDCYRLYQVVVALQQFEEVLTELHAEQTKFQPSIRELVLDPVRVSRHQFQKFVVLVQKMIDLKYYEETGLFRISPSSDPQLEEMNAAMEVIKKKCEKALSAVHKSLSNESVKLDVNTQYGYFFRVTLKEERTLRGARDVRILDSAKGSGVRFSTKQLDKLNQDNVSLITEYEESQDLLKKMVLDVACGYLPAFEALTDTLSVIDVLVAFSMTAATSCSNYTRPIILANENPDGDKDSQKKRVDIVGCRHPMIEKSEHVHFIPNDLNHRKDHEDSFVILTGANMGGKSTYLRSIALTVLMGQIGSFVPCDKAAFVPFDGIYTRIGAGDYQCKGVSTFMAEMVDCATILSSSTSQSLVIIDELGRGTSTFDGFGLAWAIAEYIIETKKSFTLFATHFHEVTELQKKYNCVRNMRVDTHTDENGQISLLYKVVDGVSDRSFGLNVCKAVSFPPEIMNEAASILHRYETQGQGMDTAHIVRSLKQLANNFDHMSDEELKERILDIVPESM